MISKTTLIIILFTLSLIMGEEKSDSSRVETTTVVDKKSKKIDPIFTIIQKRNRVNGLAIEYFPPSIIDDDSLAINGVHLDLDLLDITIVTPISSATFITAGAIGLIIEPIGEIDPTITIDSLSLDSYSDLCRRDINGVSFSTLNLNLLGSNNHNKSINGLDLNLSLNSVGSMKGLSINTLANSYITLDGFMISGLYSNGKIMNGVSFSLIKNVVSIGRGLQVGLINTSDNYKGFQIGLWNVNQDRSFPFINWSF